MSDLTRPRRHDGLYSSSVRGRFVVLDIQARQLAELHPDVQSLWPLLDGRHTLSQLARLWPVAAGTGGDQDGLPTVQAVTEQLAAAGLLELEHG